MKIFQLKLVVLCIVVLFSTATALAGEPRQIILTWEDDPMTTMTITWRTEHKGDSVVRFSPVEERLEQEWKQVEARTFTFDETKAWIHTAKLTGDRKSTRLNSSHVRISYAVFCLKKKKKKYNEKTRVRITT